jgi:hypothetical protein
MSSVVPVVSPVMSSVLKAICRSQIAHAAVWQVTRGQGTDLVAKLRIFMRAKCLGAAGIQCFSEVCPVTVINIDGQVCLVHLQIDNFYLFLRKQ